MFAKKMLVVAAVAGSFALTGVASAAGNQRVVFVGGHEPMRMVRTVELPVRAPYALTGNETSVRKRLIVPIRVGSRIVGHQVIDNK